MAGIEIIATGERLFHVEITDDDGLTLHEVGVPDGYADSIGAAHVTHDALVIESVRFLLEREPKEQILRAFDLPDIQRFFPDYELEIRRRLPGDPPE